MKKPLLFLLISVALAGARTLVPTGMDVTGEYCIMAPGDTFSLLGYGTVSSVGLSSSSLTVTGTTITGTGAFTVELPAVGTAGTYTSVTTDAKGRVTAGTALSLANNPSRTIQTVAASANGWRPTGGDVRNYTVHYSVSTSCTATIGGASSATVVLETALTNSATAGDWTTIGKIANGQTITLAIALQSIQTGTIDITREIPAGSYVRLRSTLTGTSSCTLDSGQETIW